MSTPNHTGVVNIMMFIAPKPRRTTPYDCATSKDNAGNVGIKDESGALIGSVSEP